MKTIKDIYNMCRAYWYTDETCFYMVCDKCPLTSICEMQLFAIYDLLKAGEYH